MIISDYNNNLDGNYMIFEQRIREAEQERLASKLQRSKLSQVILSTIGGFFW